MNARAPRRPSTPMSLAALLGAAATCPAQAIVIPAIYDTQEAGSVTDVAGFSDAFRQQLLVRDDLLEQAAGKQIDGLWLRRNHSLGATVQAETASITVTVSDNARHPAAPARAFAQNHGASPAVVFSGTLPLPSSAAITPPYPWQSPYAVRIPFSPGWRYQAGHLCIEIEGTPLSGLSGANWWVDAFVETTGSAVTTTGAACGATAARGPKTLYARDRTLMPGGELLVGMFAVAGSTGALALGTAPTAVPLDPTGAPGCSVTVVPQATLPVAFAATGAPDTLVRLRLPIPATPQLLGAAFYMQGASVEIPPVSNPAGLTTTNGLQLTLGPTMPPASISMVASARSPGATAPRPTTGEIGLSRGPVIRLELR